MSGDLGDIGESVGDAAAGAMVARAIEPQASGPAAGGHTAEGACLNCGTPLVGPHCHQCGQRAHVHRTLSAFFHDLLHGVLHFEGKTWRTLPLLVWKPGKLTREYIDGKRASYVSPIALFLFVVFFSFALFNLIGGGDTAAPDGKGAVAVASVDETIQAELARLRQERADSGTEPAEIAEIDARIAELSKEQEEAARVLEQIGSDFAKGFTEDPLPEDSSLARAIAAARDNPQLAIYKIQTNAYKFSWLLIPLSVPFVWLLFAFNRRFRGYDHTVFTTYSIAFMIALVAAASLLGYVGWEGTGLLLLLYAPWHMYRQLRGAYGVGRFGAFWRMLALNLFAWVAIGLFIAAISAMSAGT